MSFSIRSGLSLLGVTALTAVLVGVLTLDLYKGQIDTKKLAGQVQAQTEIKRSWFNV